MAKSGSTTKKTESDWPYLKFGLIAAGIVIVFWFGVTELVLFRSGYLYERGAWLGDSFGAVNALFSALAFVGVVLAIVMQKHEL